MSDFCPAGCGRTPRRGQLLCPRCWSKVPARLQAEVYRTWRAWQRDFGDVELMRAYRVARDNAIAAVP